MPGYLVVDAKSLYDSLMTPGSLPKERRVALDRLAVGEALARPTDEIRWVPTRHMLADIMTKHMRDAPPYLDYVLSRGQVSLTDTQEAAKLLEDAADKEKQRKEQKKKSAQGQEQR